MRSLNHIQAKDIHFSNKVERFEVAKYDVLFHHEHYNGEDYPDGLKGDEIPMIAQIIAVADVNDALTSDRAYRGAVTCRDAMNILIEGKDAQSQTSGYIL
ncbi:MAG: hypothetical protein JEZ08_03210 [Clostridiales bacterium]|nr:hypothetical protein [Clostridiales bacterium]